MRSFNGKEKLMTRSRTALSLALALLLVAATGSALAQQVATGTILGVVRDTSGAVVPEAKVTATQASTGQSRSVTSGAQGEYRIPAMPVGPYTVRFEKADFGTQTQQGLELNIAQELVVNANLAVGTTTQEVTVSGEMPVVNTTSGALGGLVNEQKISELPLNGRNFIDLSLLQTGVTQNYNRAGSSSALDVSFSSNGAPIRANSFLLDGATIANIHGLGPASASGTTLGVEGIREYKVITSNFPAEYGMNMGSQMLMVSKGGTNQFHGSAFEYLRNDVLNARNYFDAPQQADGRRLPGLRRNNFGGSLSPPSGP